MKSQPNRNYTSNDVVMTPPELAVKIVTHFLNKPNVVKGILLDPCKGTGAFLDAFPVLGDWCELTEDKDFLAYTANVQWIITNPPWSKVFMFLDHGMEIAQEVVYLFTVNHMWTKARLRLLDKHGFGIKEIILIDTPRSFPQTGFQLGVIHLSKGYNDAIVITDWRETKGT